MLKPNHFIIPIIVIVAALIGGTIISSNMWWYSNALRLPALTPPPFVFGLAWTLIYILAAFSALKIYNDSRLSKREVWHIVSVFILNAALNVLWTYVFFQFHQFSLAVLNAVILDATVWLLIRIIRKHSKLSAYMLLPYALWGLFAIYLTFAVAILN